MRLVLDEPKLVLDEPHLVPDEPSWTKPSKPLGVAFRHGVSEAGTALTRATTGYARRIGEFIEPTPKGEPVFPALTDFWKRKSDRLKAWADSIELGLREWEKAHPEERMEIRPEKGGFVKRAAGVTGQFLKDPALMIQGVTETVPMLAEAALGHIIGANWAGMNPRVARTLGMAIPIIGQTYSELREQGVPIENATAESILVGVGEGAIEEWTLGRKIGIFSKLSGAARMGVARGAIKFLLGAGRAYGRGAAEEAGQELNRNFWHLVFTDPDQDLMANVAESAGAGGVLEMVMTGGFAAAGKTVSLGREQKVERVESIREKINESPMKPEHKEEINNELDRIKAEVETGQFDEAKPTEPAPVVPVAEKPAEEPIAKKPEKVKPKLYIGNVTQRMRKVFAKIWGKKPSEVKPFTERGFPTKRTGIEVTRQEAQKAHDELVEDLKTQFEQNKIRTESDLALANAHWGDIVKLREALDLPKGQRPFKVIRARGEDVRIIKNTKSRIWGAVKPSTLFPSGMTVQQVLDATMKKAEIVSAKAYLEGARETVKAHKDLARYANERLKGVDITQSERKRLLSFVTTNRTEAEKVRAIAAIEMLFEKVDQRQAIKELNTLVPKLRNRIGKTMQEKGIRPEYARKLNTLMDSFTTKKLSQWRIRDIQSLGNYLRNLKEGISNDASLDEAYRAQLAESLIPNKRLAQLSKLSQSSIHLLKAEDIRTITTELKRLVHLNDVKNKIYLHRKARHAAEYLKRAVNEQEQVKDERKLPKEETLATTQQRRGVLKSVWGFIAGVDNHDIKTLVYTLEGGKEGAIYEVMVEDFRDGRRVQADHKVRIYKYIRDYLDKNNISDSDLSKISPAFQRALRAEKAQKVRKPLGKEIPKYKVKIAGREVSLTMAEMMSIYMHAQSDFNLKAMLNEGIASVAEEKGTLSPEELAAIVNKVKNNKTALDLCKMYQHIAESINKPAINETSMDLKGIEIADVENYFTVERYTRGKVAGNQEYQINLLESQGFLQERIGSKNPIVIRDFFAVLLANVDGVSEYVGMAKPFRAAHTILGYKNWAKVVDSKGHELQRRHLNTMMERTEQRPRIRGKFESIFVKPMRGVTRAVLANPGIWLGQIFSEVLYRSPNVAIPNKYFRKNYIPSSKEVDRCCEHFPWAWIRRNLGVTSIATRDVSRTDLALRAFTGKQQVLNLSIAPINYVDMKAITYGWLSVENWVADTTDLKKGTKEFYTEVNKRAHKIISETQPMFEPENRSILTSSPNILVRSFVLFRSYIDQTLRLMSRARTAERNGLKSKTHTAAVASVILASFVAWKLMRILVDALIFGRRRDPYEITKDVALSPMRVFTVVGYPAERAVSRMLDIRFGRRLKPAYFEARFENIITATMNELWSAFGDFSAGAAYLGTGEVYKSGDNRGELKSTIMLSRATEKLAYSIGKLLGLPTPAIQKLRWGYLKKKKPKKSAFKRKIRPSIFKKTKRKPIFKRAG